MTKLTVSFRSWDQERGMFEACVKCELERIWKPMPLVERNFAGIAGLNPPESIDICIFWVLCVGKECEMDRSVVQGSSPDCGASNWMCWGKPQLEEAWAKEGSQDAKNFRREFCIFERILCKTTRNHRQYIRLENLTRGIQQLPSMNWIKSCNVYAEWLCLLIVCSVWR